MQGCGELVRRGDIRSHVEEKLALNFVALKKYTSSTLWKLYDPVSLEHGYNWHFVVQAIFVVFQKMRKFSTLFYDFASSVYKIFFTLNKYSLPDLRLTLAGCGKHLSYFFMPIKKIMIKKLKIKKK